MSKAASSSSCLFTAKAKNNADGEDEFDLLGKLYANKLRKLNLVQKIYAEKIINDTLFEAELCNLNRKCYLKVVDPPRQRPADQDSKITSDIDLKKEYDC